MKLMYPVSATSYSLEATAELAEAVDVLATASASLSSSGRDPHPRMIGLARLGDAVRVLT
jgi:hypothetical protein